MYSWGDLMQSCAGSLLDNLKVSLDFHISRIAWGAWVDGV